MEKYSPSNAGRTSRTGISELTKRKRTGEVRERASSLPWKTTYKRDRWSEIEAKDWVDLHCWKTDFNCRELVDGGYDDRYLTHLHSVLFVRFVVFVQKKNECEWKEDNVAVCCEHVVAGRRFAVVPGEMVTKNREAITTHMDRSLIWFACFGWHAKRCGKLYQSFIEYLFDRKEWNEDEVERSALVLTETCQSAQSTVHWCAESLLRCLLKILFIKLALLRPDMKMIYLSSREHTN